MTAFCLTSAFFSFNSPMNCLATVSPLSCLRLFTSMCARRWPANVAAAALSSSHSEVKNAVVFDRYSRARSVNCLF